MKDKIKLVLKNLIAKYEYDYHNKGSYAFNCPICGHDHFADNSNIEQLTKDFIEEFDKLK